MSTVLICVDHSMHSEYALECEYFPLFMPRHNLHLTNGSDGGT